MTPEQLLTMLMGGELKARCYSPQQAAEPPPVANAGNGMYRVTDPNSGRAMRVEAAGTVAAMVMAKEVWEGVSNDKPVIDIQAEVVKLPK
jgi:hypothetical protein